MSAAIYGEPAMYPKWCQVFLRYSHNAWRDGPRYFHSTDEEINAQKMYFPYYKLCSSTVVGLLLTSGNSKLPGKASSAVVIKSDPSPSGPRRGLKQEKQEGHTCPPVNCGGGGPGGRSADVPSEGASCVHAGRRRNPPVPAPLAGPGRQSHLRIPRTWDSLLQAFDQNRSVLPVSGKAKES